MIKVEGAYGVGVSFLFVYLFLLDWPLILLRWGELKCTWCRNGAKDQVHSLRGVWYVMSAVELLIGTDGMGRHATRFLDGL